MISFSMFSYYNVIALLSRALLPPANASRELITSIIVYKVAEQLNLRTRQLKTDDYHAENLIKYMRRHVEFCLIRLRKNTKCNGTA